MTKKKVEVNEDVLKNIIVGDIPVFGREKPKEESTEQPGTEVPLATEPAEAPSAEFRFLSLERNFSDTQFNSYGLQFAITGFGTHQTV